MGVRASDGPVAPPGAATLGDWLRHAERRYARARVAFGQVATNAHDEALYLLLRTLGLPLDCDARVLAKQLSSGERAKLDAVLHRRLVDHVPAAYLTREAWLGKHRFYVDERVIIPRSYFLEIIPQLARIIRAQTGNLPAFDDVGAAGSRARSGHAGLKQNRQAVLPSAAARGMVQRIADVCTGSGCLAILAAHQFPSARVDACDLSAAALQVAKINVRAHRLTRRVRLFQGDVFDSVPREKYDVILSNPPYESSARVDAQPPEFAAEPRMAHDGGRDGLAIIRKLLAQASTRVAPHGIVLIEVGGLRRAIDREFAPLEPHWLHTEDGADCVCVFQAARLMHPRTAPRWARLPHGVRSRAH